GRHAGLALRFEHELAAVGKVEHAGAARRGLDGRGRRQRPAVDAGGDGRLGWIEQAVNDRQGRQDGRRGEHRGDAARAPASTGRERREQTLALRRQSAFPGPFTERFGQRCTKAFGGVAHGASLSRENRLSKSGAPAASRSKRRLAAPRRRLAVASEKPQRSATSASVRPSTWCRTNTMRSFAGSLSIMALARSKRSRS